MVSKPRRENKIGKKGKRGKTKKGKNPLHEEEEPPVNYNNGEGKQGKSNPLFECK